MWKLTKTLRFEAAHQLNDHDGKCRRLHGHSWVLHLTVRGDWLIEEGPKRGMVIDYGDLGQVLGVIYDMLDHTNLDDTLRKPGSPEFIYPTSENVARWAYDMARNHLFTKTWAISLDSVVVEETCTARCEYTEEDG